MGTGGSSSGIGTAASFWAANVGTETSGSILSPASANMLVGIKPTVGRISRYGVIPITADQDTPGPMARSVADAAVLLGVLESAAPDPNDAATKACTPPPGRDYTKFLNPAGLKGARIGIPRAFFYDRSDAARGERSPRGGLNPAQAKMMAEAIDVLKQQGAVIVDPADIPSVVDHRRRRRTSCSGRTCGGLDNAKGKDADCSVVFKYGMKRDFNAWLASLGAAAPVKTLTELRLWNVAHQRAGAIKYGQALLDISDEMNVGADRARYQADRDEGHPAERHRGHRRRDEGEPARRAAVPRNVERVDCREAGLSDGLRAVWIRGAGRRARDRRRPCGCGRPAGGRRRRARRVCLPGRIQPEAVADRRELHRAWRAASRSSSKSRTRSSKPPGNACPRNSRGGFTACGRRPFSAARTGYETGSRPISRLTAAKASSANSSSSRVWAAEIWVRMRALPCGTTG